METTKNLSKKSIKKIIEKHDKQMEKEQNQDLKKEETIDIDPTINNISSDIPTIKEETTEKTEPIISQITKTDYLKLKNEKNPNIPRIKEFGIDFIPTEGIKQNNIDILGGKYIFSIFKNRTFEKTSNRLIPKNTIRDILQNDSRENPTHKEENDRIRNLLDSIR